MRRERATPGIAPPTGRRQGDRAGADYRRGYRKGIERGEAQARAEERRASAKRAAAEGACLGYALRPSSAPVDGGQAALGCDPTYVFPDGTNGCTHNYGD